MIQIVDLQGAGLSIFHANLIKTHGYFCAEPLSLVFTANSCWPSLFTSPDHLLSRVTQTHSASCHWNQSAVSRVSRKEKKSSGKYCWILSSITRSYVHKRLKDFSSCVRWQPAVTFPSSPLSRPCYIKTWRSAARLAATSHWHFIFTFHTQAFTRPLNLYIWYWYFHVAMV